MFIRNQTGDACVNLKCVKVLRMVEIGNNGYIEAIDIEDSSNRDYLGVYSSPEKAMEELNKAVEMSTNPDKESYIHTLPMDENLDPLDVRWALRHHEWIRQQKETTI